MSVMPEISVILPFYNDREYLPGAVASVLRQSYADFELIMVDDGSTDGSLSIARNFADGDSRLRLLTQPNGGPGAARNRGLEEAMGKYICFLDADDMFHPEFLKTLHVAIEGSGYAMVMGQYRKFKESAAETFQPVSVNIAESTPLDRREIFSRLFHDLLLFAVVWGKLYRRELIGTHRFGPYGFGEDMEFNSRVFGHLEKALLIETPLYWYRLRPDSVSHSRFSEANIWQLKAMRDIGRNMQGYDAEQRGHMLKRLYKDIMSQRKLCTPDYKERLEGVLGEIYAETLQDFKTNPTISPGFKHAMLLFRRCPAAYNLYRAVMALPYTLKILRP